MRRFTRWLAVGSAATVLAACGGDNGGRESGAGPGIDSLGPQTSSGTEDGSGPATSMGPGPGSATGDSTAGTTEQPTTGFNPSFDLGILPDLPIPEDGCTKVDFLFTIDNSGSMAGDQTNLVNNFPAFINGIQTVLETVDEYQVGVITTDTYGFNVGGCQQLSSLVVQTGGSNSSNSVCGPYAAGRNFMTEADDLAMEFTCAADVGTSGSATERPMQATVEAVQRVQGGAGQCNEDFLRDDSLLVIVIITDEPGDSPGSPASWFNDIVAARSGIEENIAVVSLINTPGGSCGGSTANEISSFTNMFTNGFEADVCTPDYGPVFQQAIGIIEEACNNFTPPG
ncbi:MAG: hypothetical protein AB1Z98_09815 [Nannocystaceae bacterium]